MKNKLILMAAVVLLAGCKTKERIVTIETVRTDTTYITRHERDSIHERDSTHVSEKQRGDTIFVEVERLRRIYINKTKHDTIYISKTDSVPTPYPVEVEVPAPLTWWQQARLHLANIVLWALGLWIGLKILRRKSGF
jgi:hypothetical protein